MPKTPKPLPAGRFMSPPVAAAWALIDRVRQSEYPETDQQLAKIMERLEKAKARLTNYNRKPKPIPGRLKFSSFPSQQQCDDEFGPIFGVIAYELYRVSHVGEATSANYMMETLMGAIKRDRGKLFDAESRQAQAA